MCIFIIESKFSASLDLRSTTAINTWFVYGVGMVPKVSNLDGSGDLWDIL